MSSEHFECHSIQTKEPKVKTMGRIIGIVFGGVSVFNGIAILTTSDCQTVSFAGKGSRVAVAQCFADSGGALPGWLAGIGMIVVGGTIGLVAVKRN